MTSLMSGRRKILARQERQAEAHLEWPGPDLFAEYRGKKSSVKKEEGFVIPVIPALTLWLDHEGQKEGIQYSLGDPRKPSLTLSLLE